MVGLGCVQDRWERGNRCMFQVDSREGALQAATQETTDWPEDPAQTTKRVALASKSRESLNILTIFVILFLVFGML